VSSWDTAIDQVVNNNTKYVLGGDSGFCALGAIGFAVGGDEFLDVIRNRQFDGYRWLRDHPDSARMTKILAATIREQFPDFAEYADRDSEGQTQEQMDQDLVFQFNDLAGVDCAQVDHSHADLVAMFQKAQIKDEEMINLEEEDNE
jgi:hypothetical protein